MNKHIFNNHEQTIGAGVLLHKIGMFTIRLVTALLAMLCELFATTKVQHNVDRRLHDSDLSGKLNHNTARLDAGADPYGWYDD